MMRESLDAARGGLVIQLYGIRRVDFSERAASDLFERDMEGMRRSLHSDGLKRHNANRKVAIPISSRTGHPISKRLLIKSLGRPAQARRCLKWSSRRGRRRVPSPNCSRSPIRPNPP